MSQTTAENLAALKRAQRALGVRASNELLQSLQAAGQADEIDFSAFNVLKAVQYKPERWPVIISISTANTPAVHDGEIDAVARCINTVGVAKLDTQELKRLCPGNEGEHWAKHIESTLLTISERVPTGDGNAVVLDFEGNAELNGTADDAKHWLNRTTNELRTRNIIILGHSIHFHLGEIAIEFGVDFRNRVMEVIDLRQVYSGAAHLVHQYNDTTAFSAILANLSKGEGNRRNPGNRALYTLEAFLAITINAAIASNPPTSTAITSDDSDGGPFTPPAHGFSRSDPDGRVMPVRNDSSLSALPTLAERIATLRISNTDQQEVVEDASDSPWSQGLHTPPSTRPVSPAVLHTDESAQAPGNDTSSSSGQVQITSTEQVDLPMNLRTKFSDCYNSTRRLAVWLVAVARQYDDISDKYTQNTDTVRMFDGNQAGSVEFTAGIRTYVTLARMIQANHRHREARMLRYLNDVVNALEQNIGDRQQVSAHYVSCTRPCQPKSQLEKDNADKQFFIEEILKQVLEALKETARARAPR